MLPLAQLPQYVSLPQQLAPVHQDLQQVHLQALHLLVGVLQHLFQPAMEMELFHVQQVQLHNVH